MNTATGGTHDDRVRSTDAVRAGIEMAACVRTFSELSPEKRIRCLFRNPYEVVDLLQQLPAGTIPACIAQGVDLDLFLQLLHRSDRLPCRIAYADGDIVVTRLTTSSYHAGAADVFTSILTSMAPLGSFGDYADTGFQMGNFVIGADRALQTRPPTSAPPGEFTSTTGNRRTPSIVVEACVGQSWHSTLLKYPFDLSRPASDRRQWSGLDKATIWVDPFQTGAFDPRSNVQEVLIVKLYSSNRMRAGRVSRHFPTSTFDEHGRVECVEDVEFGPDSCNALGQAFIHSNGAAALRIDLYFLQQSMRF
ncbi:unnamed protein product (mitochondrion) [Plasmodiophora brassicae]|uniref:Uncharacterized protein n=1 Tax=Plasmodiophora brassicae TaxID=37360 RepID=A0A3P3YMT9_PLABS|nr:unnamed protein product [Plasmodiophora brassicae]